MCSVKIEHFAVVYLHFLFVSRLSWFITDCSCDSRLFYMRVNTELLPDDWWHMHCKVLEQCWTTFRSKRRNWTVIYSVSTLNNKYFLEERSVTKHIHSGSDVYMPIIQSINLTHVLLHSGLHILVHSLDVSVNYNRDGNKLPVRFLSVTAQYSDHARKAIDAMTLVKSILFVRRSLHTVQRGSCLLRRKKICVHVHSKRLACVLYVAWYGG